MYVCVEPRKSASPGWLVREESRLVRGSGGSPTRREHVQRTLQEQEAVQTGLCHRCSDPGPIDRRVTPP